MCVAFYRDNHHHRRRRRHRSDAICIHLVYKRLRYYYEQINFG